MKTIRMPKEAWEKWDKALRDGSYFQCEGKLYDSETGGYCCLGVLEHCLTGSVEQTEVFDEDAGATLEEVEVLPGFDWLKARNIEFYSDGHVRVTNPFLYTLGKTAAVANDDGKSFVEIADAIKEAVEFVD